MSVLQQQTTLRFGLFQLDLQAHELYRGGIRIRLAPQPYELLAALLEQPGSVVTREALRRRLWPDTYVDYEHGLNKTVRKLREALGDSAESPRYIETVQRSGYRFIAPVQLDAPASALPASPGTADRVAPSPATAQVQPAALPDRVARRVAILIGFGLIAGLTSFLIWRHAAPHSERAIQTKSVNTRAQDAYLHGRYLWFSGHPLAASDYFKRAIDMEPDHGAAWAGMSMYYGAALLRGRMDPAEALDLQQQAAAKSLRFAPDLAEAHLATCGSLFLNTWNYKQANEECERALRLDPGNAETYHFQSKMLAAVNREQAAVEVQRTSSRLDPLSKPWELSQALMQARRYDEAFTEGRVRLETFPHDPRLLYLLASISRYRGSGSQYVDYLEQSYRSDSDELSAAQIHDAYRSGNLKAVEQWNLEHLLKQSRTGYVSPFRLAQAYINTGDREHAIAQLIVALDRHTPDLLWVRCYREFDVLEPDPRYQRILQHLPRM